MSTSRRLAAVMFSDIEGFSGLMQKDEANALKLKDGYRLALDACHAQFNGEVVHYFGDGCLSIFKSALDAMECAICMQQQYQDKVPVRIGMHLGDIIATEDDVYGDGVNVASRIESLGVVGAILISDRMQAELHNHPEIKTASVGVYQLKNIDRPMEVFALANEGLVIPKHNSLQGKTAKTPSAVSLRKKRWIGLGVLLLLVLISSAYWYSQKSSTPPADALARVAVLPFRNISSQAENEYLSDGITEELTSSLSGISGLKVISRNSVLRYKNSTKTIRQIGKELGISVLIEGSVIKEGTSMRIMARMIDATTDEILWSDHFQQGVGEILIFYSQVVQQVAHKLNVTLRDAEVTRLGKADRVNPELHQLYLKGLFYSNKFTDAGYHEAVQQFDQALRIDSNYAPALAGKAFSYALMGVFNPSLSTKEALLKTQRFAQKALKADDHLPLAYIALGYSKLFFQRDLKGAETALNKAIEVDPSNDMALTALVLINLYNGNTTAAAALTEKGKSISPFSFFLTHQEGRILFRQNKPQEAIESYLSAIRLHNHPLLYDHLAGLYNQLGKYKEAIHLLDSSAHKFGDLPPSSLSLIAEAYYKSGDKQQATLALAKLQSAVAAQRPNYAFFTAAYYAGIGDTTQCYHMLDAALVNNDVDLLWLKV